MTCMSMIVRKGLDMKNTSGLYINHSQETYCILSDVDTTRAIEKRCKGSDEIPKIIHFGNCDVELFESGSDELSQKMIALENQFYEDLTKYNRPGRNK